MGNVDLKRIYDEESKQHKIKKGLGLGQHIFFKFPYLYIVNKHLNDSKNSYSTTYNYNIIVFPKISNTIIDDIINEIKQLEELEYGLNINTISSCSDGWQSSYLPINKTFDNIFINKNIKLSLISDIDKFKSSKDEYKRIGIPYKRGYLLYGELGCGKSSIIKAIAHYLNYPIYYLNLNGIKNENLLMTLYNSLPKECLLVLEDIDCTIEGLNREDNNTETSSISLSIILNVLDGILSKDGIITIMTTNYKEKLDTALLRTGRIDYHLELLPLEKDIAIQMFKYWFPKLEFKTFEQYLIINDILISYPINPAKYQEILLNFKQTIKNYEI